MVEIFEEIEDFTFQFLSATELATELNKIESLLFLYFHKNGFHHYRNLPPRGAHGQRRC